MLKRTEQSSNLRTFRKLPSASTTLIGRRQELVDICALLTSPEVRLLTLLGPGGIGKTRLSIEVASELQVSFADGVCFITMAAIHDAKQVLTMIAHELDLSQDTQDPYQQIEQYLQEKRFLLIIDNFEQVVQAAPWLESLLGSCVYLKVLVTSRAVLHISSEHLFWLTPLALPDLRHLPESEAIAQYPAVALFIQRARALQPDFRITDANVRSLAEICVRLDGLPLAIELAAARIKLLPPQALLPRLKHSLQVLTKSTYSRLAQQQTLRHTIQWSYDLLLPEEQRLFCYLGVFAGGFTLQAAEALCAALEATNETSALDGMDALVDHSLLQTASQNEDDEPRLFLLQTLQEYARERLAESGAQEAANAAHARWYLQYAEAAAREINGPQQARWMRRLEQEHDNLLAAMAWMLNQIDVLSKTPYSDDCREMALRLGSALEQFWILGGHLQEGWTFMQHVLPERLGVPMHTQAAALSTAAILVSRLYSLDRAEGLFEESLRCFRSLGNKDQIASTLRRLGWIAHQKGQVARAQVLYQQCLELFREQHNRAGIANALLNQAFIAQTQRNYACAFSLLEEVLEHYRALQDKSGILSTLYQRAQILLVSQEDAPWQEISDMLEEGLALALEIGDRRGAASMQAMRGWLAFRQSKLTTASQLVEESLAFYKGGGDRLITGHYLQLLGSIRTAQGDYSAAQLLFKEGLAISQAAGDKSDLCAECLEGLATLALARGQHSWAVRLWGHAAHLRVELDLALMPFQRAWHERELATARDLMGDETFAALWAEGEALSTREVYSHPNAWKPAPQPSRSTRKTSTYPVGLTSREVEVLRMVAKGLSDAEVAEALVISIRTVTTHLTSIYNKLGVNSRTAATRFALEHSLA